MKVLAPSRVLLVDDSPVVRERLVSLLADVPNLEVVGQATVPGEAIEAVRALRPGAVILDISMPGGSGMQVLEKIKQEPLPPLVIMFTNFAHEPYRSKCLALGADHFLDKSGDYEKLIEILREFADAKSEPRRKRHKTTGRRLAAPKI